MAKQSYTNSIYTDYWVQPDNHISMTEVDALIPNDGIKLKNPLGEKFWVKFIKKTDDNQFIGQVNNHLILPSQYNYDNLVIFKASDMWEINTTAKRNAQIPEATRLVQDFYNTFGRIPTHQEMDMLYTKITTKI
jgi:hypothetical protein